MALDHDILKAVCSLFDALHLLESTQQIFRTLRKKRVWHGHMSYVGIPLIDYVQSDMDMQKHN